MSALTRIHDDSLIDPLASSACLEVADGVRAFVDFAAVGSLVVAVRVGVDGSLRMVGTVTRGRLVGAAGAVAIAAGGATVVRLTADERPACVVPSVGSAVVAAAPGTSAGLEGAVGAEVARTVAGILTVTCAWAPEI